MEATVIKCGNSAAIVLPAAWRKRYNIDIGDVLTLDDSIHGELRLAKTEHADKLAAIDKFERYLESLPKIPWERGDTPADDRELIGERYA